MKNYRLLFIQQQGLFKTVVLKEKGLGGRGNACRGLYWRVGDGLAEVHQLVAGDVAYLDVLGEEGGYFFLGVAEDVFA